ncbi:ABC transporter substrate-binding protein [Xanthobacter flavus]|uniref:ABC transporter substrate-binding protein n=1 Tax=Xanthobacter flavus TaxID=281 RepID=UPI00372767BB
MISATRRLFLSAAGIALLAFASPASAQNPKLRVGGTPNYGPVLPIMAAEKLGLFKKAGVDVEFSGYQGGSASMEALAAGEADIVNFIPPGLALARARGVKARIISAGTITPRGWWVMSREDSSIKTIKDLVGKKVGTSSPGAATDFFALWVESQSGGTFTRVPVGGSGLIPNLTAKNVDAVVAFPPVSYRIASSGLGRVVVDLGAAMKPNVPDVWVASDEAIAKKPEAVKKFLAAFYGAVRYMQENRAWTIKFIDEATKFGEAVAGEEFDNTVKGLSADGAFKQEWVEESLKLATLAGMKELPPATSLYTTEFVPVTPLSP